MPCVLYFRTLQYKKVILAFIKAQKSRQHYKHRRCSAFSCASTEAMRGNLGRIWCDGIALANSFISESEELIKILPHIKRFNVEIVGMAKDEKRAF